jgi:hypothetical protein
MQIRKIGIGAALLLGVGAIIVGYATYAAWQKHAQQRRVAALVGDTTVKLRQALGTPTPDIVAALDANLKATHASRDPAFADAAEHYIIGAREITRRLVAVRFIEREAAASRAALSGHMAHSARRSDAWLRDAIELKKRVERQHYDLDLTLKGLDELLFTLPDAEKQLEPRVGSQALVSRNVIDATRKHLQADAQRANAELLKVRQLVP